MSYIPIYRDAPGIGSPPAHWEIDGSEDEARQEELDRRIDEYTGSPAKLIEMLQWIVKEEDYDKPAGRPEWDDGTFYPDAPAAELLVSALSNCCPHAAAARAVLADRIAFAAEENAKLDMPEERKRQY